MFFPINVENESAFITSILKVILLLKLCPKAPFENVYYGDFPTQTRVDQRV